MTDPRRGWRALLHDAVDATTHLVDVGHESAARSVRRVTEEIPAIRDAAGDVDGIRRGLTRGALASVRALNRGIERLGDATLDALALAPREDFVLPLRSDVAGSAAWTADALLGAVNGALGDHLEGRGSALDLEMAFRFGDRYVMPSELASREVSDARAARVALFVHGLAVTEWSWCFQSELLHGDPALHFGSMLQRDLGLAPVHLRYNTGRRIRANGERLSFALQSGCDAGTAAFGEIILIGHSMGGLIVRAACAHAVEHGFSWTTRVRHVFCLGTPHRGAPLAQLGGTLNAVLEQVDTPATQILARILETRSAGVHNLRAGEIPEMPDLPHVGYHDVGSTLTRDPRHPLGRTVGDLFVPVGSTKGPASKMRREVLLGGIVHHRLANHPEVYAYLRSTLDS